MKNTLMFKKIIRIIAAILIIVIIIFVLGRVIQKWNYNSLNNMCSSILKDGLMDMDPNVRMTTAYALGELGDKFALENLKFVLRDKNSNVRGRAVEALGKLNDKSALAPLKIILITF